MTQINNQMDKAKQLTSIALNDPNISKEDKKDFSNWLRSYHNRLDGNAAHQDEARSHVDMGNIELRRGSRLPPTSEVPHSYAMAPPMNMTTPQVTISGVTGHTSSGLGLTYDSSQLQKSRLLGSHPSLGGSCVVTQQQQQQQQDSLTASLNIYTSRPWRSNSLTPPGCISQQDWQPPYAPQSPKGRSHSLSFDHHHQMFCMGGHGVDLSNNNSCAEDEKIDEIIRALPDGSGMRELKDWLKSLRLHKYTRVLLEFSYEELLDVTEEQLEKKGVTLGARGKIFKNISLIKERPQRIQKLSDMLENVNAHNDMNTLCQILRELENYVLMPTKPYTPPPTNPIQTTSSRALSSATRTGRHDSGSDSGTDLCHDEDSSSGGPESTKNVPGLIFDTLKKVFMIILLSDVTHHEVITVFACLLERCRAKESFSETQKKFFNSWLHKLRTLWNPPPIRKANDYKRRSFRAADPTRRPSVHILRPVGLLNQFKPNFTPASTCTTSSTAGTTGAPVGHLAMIQGPPDSHSDPHPEYAPPFSPRRSMPEIKPMTFSHFKRNSYQEDRRPALPIRPNFFIDEIESNHHQQHMTSSVDFSSGLNCFGGFSSSSPFSSSASLYNRRESTMSTDSGYLMSLPESRRDSSLSNCEFGVVGSNNASQRLMNCVADFAETCSGFGDRGSHFSCGGSSALFPPFSSSGVPADRRDSGLSLMTTSTFTEDYLTVPRRGSGCHGLHHGSISSGCVSDGSTDSLLEQDLHNLSLAVTQQALE